MTQTMAPDMMQMVRALTAIEASGVQITNPCQSSWMNAFFSWGYVEAISPGGRSPVVTPPPFVTDYSVVVYQVPPGCSPYQQLFQNDSTAPVHEAQISPCSSPC